MDSKIQKIGRYYLLNLIAQGGFAEVYRALLEAGDGIHRLVALKSLHSDHSRDSEFSRAFRSEIKVSLGLTHPNIVPTFDFGEEEGRPYIVFDYLHGRSLRQVLTRIEEKSRVLAVEHAASIIEQAAAALHYAHTFRDPITREPIEIIHRDVSPQNILISFEGVPKVIDFGIAKVMAAAGEGPFPLPEDRTRTGVIKGKPAYLSPEQIRGEGLDGRSDVFALGIVLWETLTGVRLFGGKEHSIAIMAIMDNRNKLEPPSNINPAVPAELDQIVLTALARSREERYRNAKDFQAALLRYLAKADPSKNRDVYAGEIADLMSEIFADEIERDAAELVRLNDRVNQLIQTEHRRARGGKDEMPEFSLADLIVRSGRTRTAITKTPTPSSRKNKTRTPMKGPPEPMGKTLSLPDTKLVSVELETPGDRKKQPAGGPVGGRPVAPKPEKVAPRPRIPRPFVSPMPQPEPQPQEDPRADRGNESSLDATEVVPKSEPSLSSEETEVVAPPPPELRVPEDSPTPMLDRSPIARTHGERSVSQPIVVGGSKRPEPIARPEPLVRPDPGTRPVTPLPEEDHGKARLVRVAIIAAVVVFALYLMGRSGRLTRNSDSGGRFLSGSSEATDKPQNRKPASDVESEEVKRVEPEADPEYKEYSVPPIDIVPGNSKVPGHSGQKGH
jgi:serine/threonine protein kinase